MCTNPKLNSTFGCVLGIYLYITVHTLPKVIYLKRKNQIICNFCMNGVNTEEKYICNTFKDSIIIFFFFKQRGLDVPVRQNHIVINKLLLCNMKNRYLFSISSSFFFLYRKCNARRIRLIKLFFFSLAGMRNTHIWFLV